jgi:hypothetical protein
MHQIFDVSAIDATMHMEIITVDKDKKYIGVQNYKQQLGYFGIYRINFRHRERITQVLT